MLKGFSRAIDILSELKKEDSRYKLYVAGKRPEEFSNSWNVPEQRRYYLDVYKRIEESDLKDSVIYSGWVKTADFLKNIGYTLSLSDKTFPESFHIAPFEGMASGVPLIATDVGIVPEILGTKQKDFIIGDRDNGNNDVVVAKKLKEKIIYLYNNRNVLKELSNENMPIILDEAFAYYDEERLTNILKYLSEEFKDNQIIIFTCTDREKEILENENIPYQLTIM